MLDPKEKSRLIAKARELREEIVKVTYACGGTHIGGAFSQNDMLTAIYYKYLRFDPKNPGWADRDRFILSKGHGGVGHAAALGDVGFFDPAQTPFWFSQGGAVPSASSV